MEGHERCRQIQHEIKGEKLCSDCLLHSPQVLLLDENNVCA